MELTYHAKGNFEQNAIQYLNCANAVHMTDLFWDSPLFSWVECHPASVHLFQSGSFCFWWNFKVVAESSNIFKVWQCCQDSTHGRLLFLQWSAPCSCISNSDSRDFSVETIQFRNHAARLHFYNTRKLHFHVEKDFDYFLDCRFCPETPRYKFEASFPKIKSKS